MVARERENVDTGGHYLGAIDMRGARLDKPYVAQGKDLERLMEIRVVTSKYGRLIEKTALQLWTGKLDVMPEDKEIIKDLSTRLKSDIKRELKELPKSRRDKAFDIAELYRKFADYDSSKSQEPRSQELQELIAILSQAVHLDFSQEYKQIPIAGSEISYKVVYLVNTLLSLSQLIQQSVPIEGKYCLNIDVPKEGVPQVKFDLIVTPSSPCPGKDFDPLAKNYKHWQLVEIKDVARLREVVEDFLHPARKFYPQTHHVRQVLHQLGAAMIEWDDKWHDGSLMPLPKKLNIVHIRAVPYGFFAMNMNSQALENWRSSLDGEFSKHGPKATDKMSRLWDLLVTYYNREKDRENKKRARDVQEDIHTEQKRLAKWRRQVEKIWQSLDRTDKL